jgi:hypothetical protein
VTLSNLPFPVLLSNCKKINLSYIIINFTIHLKLWIFKSLKLVNTLFKFKAKKCYHLLFPMRFLKKNIAEKMHLTDHINKFKKRNEVFVQSSLWIFWTIFNSCKWEKFSVFSSSFRSTHSLQKWQIDKRTKISPAVIFFALSTIQWNFNLNKNA